MRSSRGGKMSVLGAVMAAALVAGASSAGWWERVPAKDHKRANPVAATGEAVAAGGIVYRDHCAQCHRADAQGDGKKKPSLRSARINAATDGDIEWFLRQGDLGHGMPSWSSLPEAQRWQVIAYLRSLKR